jgi:hypothetical protein
MCGAILIASDVLACRPCWFSLPRVARTRIMRQPRGNVRARAFYTYLHEHSLSRLSPSAGGGQ